MDNAPSFFLYICIIIPATFSLSLSLSLFDILRGVSLSLSPASLSIYLSPLSFIT